MVLIIKHLLILSQIFSQDSTVVIFNESQNTILDSENPLTELLTPNPWGSIESGALIEFSWVAEDAYFGEQPINIYYTESIGGYFIPLMLELYNDGTEQIELPSINEAFVRFKILSTDFYGNTAEDFSDGYFTIGNPLGELQDTTVILVNESSLSSLDSKNPTIELYSPNGGEVFIGDMPIYIEWLANDDSFYGNAISFGISPFAGSYFQPFGFSVPNTGYQSFNTPELNTNYARLQIAATDGFGNLTLDYTDNYFSIFDTLEIIIEEDTTITLENYSEIITMDSKNPILDLIEPNGGNQIDSGSDITVDWFADDDTFSETPIDFSIAIGIGEYFIPVENDVPNLSEFIITLPEENHAFVRMRIHAEDLFGNTSQDESEDYFILGDPFEDYLVGEFDDLVILNWGWGKYHLVAISSDALSFLDPGDEIYILDENGIIEEGCLDNNEDSIGPIITGTITYEGPTDLPLPIICTGSINYCDMNGPRLPGYIDNNEIHFLIHVSDIDEIYEVFPTSYTIGSGIFGEPLTMVDSFESPQLMDRSELPDLNHLRNNRVDYTANILRNDNLIESLEDSDFYFDTDVLLGEEYCYMVELVDVNNIEILSSSTECLIIGGETIWGCTDSLSFNYNNIADDDDGSCIYYGDINTDGSIDVVDVIALVGFALGMIEPTPEQTLLGDVYPDGIINIYDIVSVISIIMSESLLDTRPLTDVTLIQEHKSLQFSKTGSIAGIHIEYEGEFESTLEGWMIEKNENTILMVSIDGSDLNKLNYSGDLKIKSCSVVDWELNKIEVEITVIPDQFSLKPANPNPFNPVTTINYAIPHDAYVVIKAFDVRGKEIAELVNGKIEEGNHEVVWDASQMSSGMYFVRMTSGDYKAVRKIIFLK